MGKLKFRVARPEDAEALRTIYAPYVEETAITFEYEVPSVEAFRARIAHTLATYPYIVAVEEQEANAGTGRVDGASASCIDRAEANARTAHVDDASASCIDRAEANAGTAHVDGASVSSAPASGADEVTEAHRTSEHIIGYAYVGRLHERAAYDWSVETSIYVDRCARKHGLGRQLYERLEAILRVMNIISVNACIAYPGTNNDQYLNTNSPDFHAHLGYQLVGHFHACAYKFDRWYDMIWMEKWIAPHPAKPEAMIPFPELPTEVVARCLR